MLFFPLITWTFRPLFFVLIGQIYPSSAIIQILLTPVQSNLFSILRFSGATLIFLNFSDKSIEKLFQSMMNKNSILDPLTCGFSKVRCYNLFTCKSYKCLGKDLVSARYEDFCNTFDNVDAFMVDKTRFKRFISIVKNIQNLGKRDKKGKADVLAFFSFHNWNSLNEHEQKNHSLLDCKGCTENLVYKSKLANLKTLRIHFEVKRSKKNYLLMELSMS